MVYLLSCSYLLFGAHKVVLYMIAQIVFHKGMLVHFASKIGLVCRFKMDQQIFYLCRKLCIGLLLLLAKYLH